ncbi:MAG: tyrosine-type recombinase/integrase [Pirellula sp.]
MSIQVMTELDLAVEDYVGYMIAEGKKQRSARDRRYAIKRLIRELKYEKFSDIDQREVTQWFVNFGKIEPGQDRPKAAPQTRHNQLRYCTLFFRWAMAMELIDFDPTAKSPKPKNKTRDRRKNRRAMTAEELELLVKVAKLRPLAEYVKTRMIGSRHKDYWSKNPITMENLEALAESATNFRNSKRSTDKKKLEGEKWALTYRCLALLGLRWNELRTLTVGRLDLDDETVTLESFHTKNSKSDRLPVPRELCNDLKAWIESHKLSNSDCLFHLPHSGVKRFYADLAVAGIPRVDKYGLELDIHALRYSFGTMLARAGVHVSLCKKLMRHSKVELTLGLYTVHDAEEAKGASGALPAIGADKEVVPIKEEPKQVAPAIPSGNDALLKAFLETADAETLRKAMLKSLGQ